MTKPPCVSSLKTFTAAIVQNPWPQPDDDLGQRENGPTTRAKATTQLHAAEDYVDAQGGGARLYGNDRRGRRILLAEYRPRSAYPMQ